MKQTGGQMTRPNRNVSINGSKIFRKDIYLDQAVKVVNDMISQQNLVKAAKPEEEKPKKAFYKLSKIKELYDPGLTGVFFLPADNIILFFTGLAIAVNSVFISAATNIQ